MCVFFRYKNLAIVIRSGKILYRAVKSKAESAAPVLLTQDGTLPHFKASSFDVLLEAIPDMVWLKDLSGLYIQCNRAFERRVGLKKEYILGKFDRDFMDAESAGFYRNNDLKALEMAFPLVREEWITFADGYHGLFEVTKSVIRDQNNQAVGVMSIAHDITQRKYAEGKMRAHREAMQALNEIAAEFAHEDYKAQIRLALSVTCEYLGMDFGQVTSIEDDACVIEVQHSPQDRFEDTFYEGMDFPLEDSYSHLLLNHSDILAVTDIEDSDYRNERCYQLVDCRAFVGTRLMIDGKLYGGLIFCSTQAKLNAFESVEFDFVHLLARWIISIIKRHQLQEQINISNKRVELALRGADLGLWDLNVVTKKAVHNHRWAEMLGYQLSEMEAGHQTWLNLLHPEDAEHVVKMADACLNNEIDELNIEFRMRHKAGHWIWVHDKGRVLERDAFGRPLRMVGTLMDITERKNIDEEIKRLAFYDALTGLPNRRLLIDRFERALVASERNMQYGALIFIDLDNFKTLNDTLGHDKGDALLVQVAARLKTCLRDSDTVARFGGDEFVVMLDQLDAEHANAQKQVEAVGDKIIYALNQVYDLNGVSYFSSPTLGATLFNGLIDSVDDSLKRADMAMYQAKNAGKNCLRFFDQHILSDLLKKTTLVEDLRYALRTDQIYLSYQPQININGEITGAEALLRWSHPKRGMVSPIEFIPLAEENGLIIPLGNWVLETGCQQLVAWAKDTETAQYSLSVNVSARQFQQYNFVEQVLEILAKTGANPQRLKLELTESMLVNDVDDVISKMSQLKLEGVSFSLDDFGTGFSSLSLLKLLPLDQLKIDKSFVRDVLTDANDAVIAKTIVALANSLGLTVIAEGVEVEGQRDFLAENGCYDYQGYFYSKPLAIDAFEDFRKQFLQAEGVGERLAKPTIESTTVVSKLEKPL